MTQDEKEKIRDLVRNIIVMYSHSSFLDFKSYYEDCLNKDEIFVYHIHEIPKATFRYINMFLIDLLFNYYKEKEIYTHFSYLKFNSKLDIIGFLKITSKQKGYGFSLYECKLICEKHKPFNWNEL